MKSRCSSDKVTLRRPLLRMLATVLSVVLLITSLGIGSIFSTSAYSLKSVHYVDVVIEENTGFTAGLVNNQHISEGAVTLNAIHKSDYDWQRWEAQGVFRVPGNTSTSWDYLFKYHITWADGNGWYSQSGTIPADNSDYWIDMRNDGNMKVSIPGTNNVGGKDSEGYGYRMVTFKPTGQDGTNSVNSIIYSAILDAISITDYSNQSIIAGDLLDVYPSLSGGSGFYDVTYNLYKGGVKLDASKYINNGKFQTMEVGTYTLSVDVADQKCPFTASSNTMTISVSASKWYVLGLSSTYGGTTKNDAKNKMTETESGSGIFVLDNVTLENYADGHAVGTNNSNFQIANENGVNFGPETSGDFEIKEKHLSKPIQMQPNIDKWFKVLMQDDALKYTRNCTITLDTNNHTVTIAPKDIVVVAKDGSARASDNEGATKYNFSIIADTTIESVGGVARASMTENTHYKSGTIATTTTLDLDGVSGAENNYNSFESSLTTAGAPISVKTTIVSALREKYYVKAFNFNGVSVLATDAGSGAYTANYTIDASETSPFLEITPIYYLTDTYKSEQSITTVTYYMEGFNDAVKNMWGDSIYAYPFYGTESDVNNSFGSYPGQPFLNINGKYSIEIPVNKNVPVVGDVGSVKIKGVTVNCGKDDHMHNLINGFSYDYQTYDSDGFYKIYEEQLAVNPTTSVTEHPNNIIQSFVYKSARNNRETYGGQVNDKWGYTNNVPATQYSSGDMTALVNDVDTNGNKWELYTNRFGNPINIFGEELSVENQSKAPLRVISSGYVASIAGDYGTGWLVYTPGANGVYNLVYNGTTYAIPPSIFAIKSSDNFSKYSATEATRTAEKFTYSDVATNYQTQYNNLKTNFSDRPVYITYESNAQLKSNPVAYRMDTKWEYTYSFQYAQAEISIEYYDEGSSSWVAEENYSAGYNGQQNMGNTSHCQAYFTNEADAVTLNAPGKTSCKMLAGDDFKIAAVAGSTGGTVYMFDGWYIKNGDEYTLVDTNGSSSGSIPATGNMNLVARFMPVKDGTLTITHTAAANNSIFGTTSLQVQVYNGDPTSSGTKIFDSGEGNNSVTLNSTYIKNTYSNYFIKVILSTTPGANASFMRASGYSYDSNLSGKYNAEIVTDGSENGTNTSTFTFKVVEDMYSLTTQLFNTLNYTSTFTVYPKYTFVYTDRDGTNVSYGPVTSTVPLTEAEKAAGHTEQNLTVSPATDRTSDYTNVLSSLSITAFKKVIEVTSVEPGADIYNTTVNCGFVDQTGITLTYYYPGSGTDTVSVGGVSCTIPTTLASGTVPGSYGSKVNLSSIVPATFNDKNFYAWCKYDDNTVGEIITTERNFNYNVVKNQKVIAVYSDSTYSTDNWNTYIDDHSITLSKTGPSAGTFYNDSLVRFTNHKTNGSVKDLTDAEYGILIVYRLTEDQAYNPSLSITNIIGREDFLSKCIISMSDNTTGINSAQHVRVTKMQIQDEKLSTLNRADIVLKSSSSKFTGADYAVVAYLKESNGTVHYAKTTAGTY